MYTILYHLFSICVEEQQNAWPGNRVVKCTMRYKFGRKFIEICGECGLWNVKITQRILQVLVLTPHSFYAKESFGMSQPAVALSFTNIMNPHLFFFAPFFFALSISYLLVARVLPCSKPVGHIHVPAKGIIFHLYLRRLVLNKTHDREIALWNARMRINLDAILE